MTDDLRIVLLLALLGATCYWIGRSTARADAADELASLRAEVADLECALDAFAPRDLVHPSRRLSVIEAGA